MGILDGLSMGSPNLLTEGASASLPNQEAIHQRVQELVQALSRGQLGPGGGLTTGPEVGQPIVPLPPFKTEGGKAIPEGPFASTGQRKRADTQALFSTVKNIVDTAEDRHYKMKVQKIQHDFETLSIAIKGYNEAQATGNQEMMKHNANIINSITSDPKKSKELAKAFDVDMNPMAEKKKKEKPNPAADALKEAFAKDMQNFQSGKSMLAPQAQAMMRQIPQTIQADPRALIMEQLTKSGVLPKGGEQLQFEADLMKIANNAMQHGLDRENKQQLAKMLSETADKRNTSMLLRTLFTVAGAKERAEIMADAWKFRAEKQLAGVQDRTKALRDKLNASGKGDDKLAANVLRSLEGQVKTLKEKIASAAKAHDTKTMQALQPQLDALQAQQKVVSGALSQKLGIDLDASQSVPTGLTQDEYSTIWELFKDAESSEQSGDNE